MSYWQSEDEPSPAWVTGSLVSALTCGISFVGMFAFGWSLIEITPWLAIILLGIIIGGSAPSVMRQRKRPVLRWVIYGLAGGVSFAIAGLVLSLLFMP